MCNFSIETKIFYFFLDFRDYFDKVNIACKIDDIL